jgi:hypothetical protein
MTAEPTYYKTMRADGLSPYARYEWPLPTDDGPGEWVEVEGDLVECKRGIHATTIDHLLEWLDDAIYVLEYDEPPVVGHGKVYGRRARLVRRIDAWTGQSARLLAADYAEHVAHLWVSPPGCDWQPSQCIDVVRRYAHGTATDDDLKAAWAAACATGAAARAAARATGYAARAAARDAAWDAAGAAARAAEAAASAEAAGSAARATGSAARAAEAAASVWAAASAWAAGNSTASAGNAAGNAEREWQTARLRALIDGEVE